MANKTLNTVAFNATAIMFGVYLQAWEELYSFLLCITCIVNLVSLVNTNLHTVCNLPIIWSLVTNADGSDTIDEVLHVLRLARPSIAMSSLDVLLAPTRIQSDSYKSFHWVIKGIHQSTCDKQYDSSFHFALAPTRFHCNLAGCYTINFLFMFFNGWCSPCILWHSSPSFLYYMAIIFLS